MQKGLIKPFQFLSQIFILIEKTRMLRRGLDVMPLSSSSFHLLHVFHSENLHFPFFFLFRTTMMFFKSQLIPNLHLSQKKKPFIARNFAFQHLLPFNDKKQTQNGNPSLFVSFLTFFFFMLYFNTPTRHLQNLYGRNFHENFPH